MGEILIKLCSGKTLGGSGPSDVWSPWSLRVPVVGQSCCRGTRCSSSCCRRPHLSSGGILHSPFCSALISNSKPGVGASAGWLPGHTPASNLQRKLGIPRVFSFHNRTCGFCLVKQLGFSNLGECWEAQRIQMSCTCGLPSRRRK